MEKSRKFDTIKENYLFSRLYSGGKNCSGRYFALYCMRNRTGNKTRIGISVSKARGKAVVRNRIKRRIREALRLYYPLMKEGQLIVVVARQASADARFRDMSDELYQLLKRAALLGNGK